MTKYTVKQVTASEARSLLMSQYISSGDQADPNNVFGLVVTEDNTPITCNHGGSMWLCKSCAESILKHQAEEAKHD